MIFKFCCVMMQCDDKYFMFGTFLASIISYFCKFAAFQYNGHNEDIIIMVLKCRFWLNLCILHQIIYFCKNCVVFPSLTTENAVRKCPEKMYHSLHQATSVVY